MGTIYSQRDSSLVKTKLGQSGLSYYDFGCTAVDVCNALNDAGYEITVKDFADELNEIGAFTDNGLLIWDKVSEAYPQFHFGNDGYHFLEGKWGKLLHWLLRTPNNNVFDPWYGVSGAPDGWVADGVVRNASIDRYVPEVEETPATPVVPVAPEVPTNPVVEGPIAPEEQPANPEPVAQTDDSYTVVENDTLGAIVKSHYELDDAKLWGPKGAVAVVAKFNTIKDPAVIHVGDVIKFPTL